MKRKRKQKTIWYITGVCLIVIVILAVWFTNEDTEETVATVEEDENLSPLIKDDSYEWPDITVDLISVNDYSRPGTALSAINNIVIHYVANPGSSAQSNRNYFEGLAESHETKASAHMVVGLEGEIIQCIPLNEVAYASNDRNYDTISIEVCHPDESGKFSDTTYESLVHLCAWLCLRYDLQAEDLIRHYDVTGKDCPKYYVENETAWQQLKDDVATEMEGYPKK
jgi:N-acetylmuramoyl-L-alanine amidase CwlA